MIAIGDGGVRLEGQEARTFRDLVDLITQKVQSEDDAPVWAGTAIGRGTVNAFVRRLQGSVRHVERLIRGDQPDPEKNRIKLDHQVTVVDLHNLHDRAKRFAVGVTVRKAFEDKEGSGQSAELALPGARRAQQIRAAGREQPDQGDPARCRRARSQPWGDPDRRPADRQRSRAPHHRQLLDPGGGPPRPRRGLAEEYGFLPAMQRQRATILKPGTMLLSQPELPGPLVLEFPFPAWATRASEAGALPVSDGGPADPSLGPLGVPGYSPTPVLRSEG